MARERVREKSEKDEQFEITAGASLADEQYKTSRAHNVSLKSSEE